MVMALHCIPDVAVDSQVVVDLSTVQGVLRVVRPVLEGVQVVA